MLLKNAIFWLIFFIIFMFFIFFNKKKASDQTASTGVRTQTYLQVLSYDNPRPFCQLNYTNLSESELLMKSLQYLKWDTACIFLPSQWVKFALKRGPPLYVKIVIFANF